MMGMCLTGVQQDFLSIKKNYGLYLLLVQIIESI